LWGPPRSFWADCPLIHNRDIECKTVTLLEKKNKQTQSAPGKSETGLNPQKKGEKKGARRGGGTVPFGTVFVPQIHSKRKASRRAVEKGSTCPPGHFCREGRWGGLQIGWRAPTPPSLVCPTGNGTDKKLGADRGRDKVCRPDPAKNPNQRGGKTKLPRASWLDFPRTINPKKKPGGPSGGKGRHGQDGRTGRGSRLTSTKNHRGETKNFPRTVKIPPGTKRGG